MGPPVLSRRKGLSAKIEAEACRDMQDPSSRERQRVAPVCLNRIPGAGAWLLAFADSLESCIPSPLFQV